MSKCPAIACLIGGLLLLPSGPMQADVLDQRHRYHIHIDEAFSELTVRACFDGRVPDALYAGSNSAGRLLKKAWLSHEGDTRELTSTHNRLRVPVQADDGCVHYVVDLGLAARSYNFGIAARTGDALVMSPRVWLWRPPRLNRYMDIYMRFDLPEGYGLSGPWEQTDAQESGEPWYRLAYPPLGWDASMAVGGFTQLTLRDHGLETDIALMNGPGDALAAERVSAWLEQAVAAAATIFGGFPGERAQVIVVPLNSGDRPLAQARVSRAGGSGLLLGISTRQPADHYEADGLLAHEFMHLLHPPVVPPHRWLSEGIASYYQYIGLARAGQLSPEQAWRQMLADMEDGYWDRRPGTLQDITRRMGREGGADYVYWSGAALMLMADVALRRRDGAPNSLDRVLAQWAECCFHSRRALDGRDALVTLDEFAGGEPVFAPLYDQYVLSIGFPAIDPLLRALGLPALGEDFQVDDDAPLAPIRRAIMQAPEQPLLDPHQTQ